MVQRAEEYSMNLALLAVNFLRNNHPGREQMMKHKIIMAYAIIEPLT